MRRANGRHNLSALERALALRAAGSAGLKSRNEAAFLSMLKNLPEPLVNTKLNGEEPDFHWPDHKLVVEIDGPGHDRPRTQREDEHKEAAWRAAGYEVLRVTERCARGSRVSAQHSSHVRRRRPLDHVAVRPRGRMSSRASSECALNASTRAPGSAARISRAARSPPPPGISTSSSTTSGRCSTASAIASSASAASATSSKTGSPRAIAPSSIRITGSSSAISRRTVAFMRATYAVQPRGREWGVMTREGFGPEPEPRIVASDDR